MCKRFHSHSGRHHWRGGHGHHFAHRSEAVFRQAPANVAEMDDRYELDIFAPGLSRDDFQIQLADRTLTVEAKAKEEDFIPEGEWMRREYRPGGFERSFSLNEKIDTDNIAVNYADGILRITLYKHPDRVTRRRSLDIV